MDGMHADAAPEPEHDEQPPIDFVRKLGQWRHLLGVLGLATNTELAADLLSALCAGNALVTLLVRKGVFTAEEFEIYRQDEAQLLDIALEERFPGFATSERGLMTTDLNLARRLIRDLVAGA